ncbi:extracellular solute-binding protein [Halanaerobium kushneri]|jgi:multiple sugar transport system substrate-binding protein|uniref:Carbohydrate ABC transporter substrate-binding protein, CUT1 family n=1 Tax=Halanaerobium kushneri TaxID=56779 RepID=A0A1N6R243_9FIRM|nr:extracellular solute-binding protein [Halanaerobium kushneri]SIQ22857.1 carbohydrate ABC transporter substrate-binding protein, CUT1 family [Halanaerobium kushneri]
MKRNKKMIIVLTVVFLLTFSFVSSATTLEIIANGTEGGKNGPIIEFYKYTLKPAFEDYMKDQGKDVTLEVIETAVPDADYKTRITLDMRAGRGPDVISFDQFWLASFVEAGLLEPLEYYSSDYSNWEGWNNFNEGVKNMMAFNDKMYGFMKNTDLRMIYYNKEIFRKANVKKWWAWQPESWEDLLNTARKIKEEMPDVTPLQLNAGEQMGEATTMQGFYMALLGAGGRLYDQSAGKWVVKSNALLDTLELYETIYVDEKLGDGNLQVSLNARDKTFEQYKNNEIAMLVEGIWFWTSVIKPDAAWGIKHRDSKIGWAAMPAQEPKAGINEQDYVSISGGTGWVPSPSTDNRELTWELLKFLNSKEMKLEILEINPGIPARNDVAESDMIQSDPYMANIAPALSENTTARPGFSEYEQVSRQVQIMTGEVVTGNLTPEEALDKYAQEVTRIVGEDKVMEK